MNDLQAMTMGLGLLLIAVAAVLALMQRRTVGPIRLVGTGSPWMERYVNNKHAPIFTLIIGIALTATGFVIGARMR